MTWIFTPAPGGYENSIVHMVDDEGHHYGHINVQAYQQPGGHYAEPANFIYYATLKTDEDSDELGGEAGRETLQSAMYDLETRYKTGQWPSNYYGGM